jgi:hypothetical protein
MDTGEDKRIDNMDKDKKIEEGAIGYTSFQASRGDGEVLRGGFLRRFIAAFFSKKGQKAIADEDIADGLEVEGDTIRTLDVTREREPQQGTDDPTGFTVAKSAVMLPRQEADRRQRYKRYEDMDEYPEIAAAFDIYADDATQKSSDDRRWIIKSEYDFVKKAVEKLLVKIRLDKFFWDITRNTVKYGDCFIETILDVNRPKLGIQRIKVLNPNFIIRVEDEFGYLKKFLQEIPQRDSVASVPGSVDDLASSRFINLDKNQLIHFRLYTSDPAFYPYGKSVAAPAMRIFRSLRLAEDAMLVYRLSRAPERRIFYVDVGNLPTSKAEVFMERLKEKFKKEKFYNANTGNVDARYNPLSADEDFFVPHRNNKGTKIETLPGAQNLGDIEDVRYFRDKLLAALKIPKDYIVEKDKSPERKANLSQLDAKFARVIVRVQKCMEIGLEVLIKRHLILKGIDETYLEDLSITLPDPSDLFAKRRLELENLKAAVSMAVVQTGLFSNEYIYKNFYEMNEQEIAEIEKQLEEQNKKAAAQQQQNQPMGGAPGGGAGMMPGTGVAPPGAPPSPSPMGGGIETAAPGAGGAAPPAAAEPAKESTDILNLLEKVKKYEMLTKEPQIKE